MGIYIGIYLAGQIPEGKWEKVYQEALDLAKKLELADEKEVRIHGHPVTCLVPVEERKWGNRTGWRAVASYPYGEPCEDFYFPKRLKKLTGDPHADALLIYAIDTSVIGGDFPEGACTSLWGGKTQGNAYHLALLAVGCLVQDRLGDQAFVHGDINAGQCQKAVRMANEHLKMPISIPSQCDVKRWMERIERLSIQGTDKIRIAMELYLGKKDASFGEGLREHFPHALLSQYWKEELSQYSIEEKQLAWTLKEYLEMGFDLGQLCLMVSYTDLEGKDQPEAFLQMIMDTKMHWKEKDCSDWLVQDPLDPTVYGVEAQLFRFFTSGARNKKVDRYIPASELRRILRENLGGQCDVDSFLDAYLESEKSTQGAKSGQTEGSKDISSNVNQLFSSWKENYETLAEKYDLIREDELQFFRPGLTIAPNLVEAMQAILECSEPLMKKNNYKRMLGQSVNYKQQWLIENSTKLYGGLRDRDWEYIFTQLEKDPSCFARYYPLFRISLNNNQLSKVHLALITNDELYHYVKSLPKKKDPSK